MSYRVENEYPIGDNLNIHNRINRFFDNNLTRGVVLIGFCLLLIRAFFPTSQSEYNYSRTENVEIVSMRPLTSLMGGHNVIISFKLQDGRMDTLRLPDSKNLKTGDQIYIDVLEHPKKHNRYRLAQPPAAP